MDVGEAEATAGGLSGSFECHRTELLRFLRARCGDWVEAEDLLQELWIRVSGQASGPVANARAYLFRMANNLVLDQLRSRHRAMARDRAWIDTEGSADMAPEDRPDSAMPADEAFARRQEALRLERAISALPPGAQRALRLHRLDGLGQAEVARVMGISRSGVEKHLAVAMKHLRKSLADCGQLRAAASRQEGQMRGGEPPVEQLS